MVFQYGGVFFDVFQEFGFDVWIVLVYYYEGQEVEIDFFGIEVCMKFGDYIVGYQMFDVLVDCGWCQVNLFVYVNQCDMIVLLEDVEQFLIDVVQLYYGKLCFIVIVFW